LKEWDFNTADSIKYWLGNGSKTGELCKKAFNSAQAKILHEEILPYLFPQESAEN
jgi:hypothetical protein